MLIVYAILISLYAAYKYSEAKDLKSDNHELYDLTKTQNDTIQFQKDTLTGLFGKPVYALLDETQVNRIAAALSAAIEKPKWLN